MIDDGYLRSWEDPFHPLYASRHGYPTCVTRTRDCDLYGCTMGHVEACYDARNRQQLDYGAHVFRRAQEKPNPPRIMKLSCFNKDEAEKAEAYMRERYPDVPFFASWLTWPTRETNA